MVFDVFDDIYLPFIKQVFCIYIIECVYLSDMRKICLVYGKALSTQCWYSNTCSDSLYRTFPCTCIVQHSIMECANIILCFSFAWMLFPCEESPMHINPNCLCVCSVLITIRHNYMFQGAGSEAATEILQFYSHFIMFSDFSVRGWAPCTYLECQCMHICSTPNKMHIYLCQKLNFTLVKKNIALFVLFCWKQDLIVL